MVSTGLEAGNGKLIEFWEAELKPQSLELEMCLLIAW